MEERESRSSMIYSRRARRSASLRGVRTGSSIIKILVFGEGFHDRGIAPRAPLLSQLMLMSGKPGYAESAIARPRGLCGKGRKPRRLFPSEPKILQKPLLGCCFGGILHEKWPKIDQNFHSFLAPFYSLIIYNLLKIFYYLKLSLLIKFGFVSPKLLFQVFPHADPTGCPFRPPCN